MNKQEYLLSLKEALKNYSPTFQEEILEAFEGHFQEGLDSGLSEEEIIDGLGSVDEVMQNIEMMAEAPQPKDTTDILKENMDALTKDIKKLTKSVTDVVSEKLANVNISIEAELSDAKEETCQQYPNQELTCVEIKGAFDVKIYPGDILKSSFTPYTNIFSKYLPTLKVEEVEDTISFSFAGGGSGKLILFVPENIQMIKADTVNGDVDAEDISISQIDIKTSSGDFLAENCHIDHLFFKSSSGDFKIDSCFTNEVEAEISSGDISCLDSEGSIQAKVISGDIKIDECKGKNLNVLSSSGDLTVWANYRDYQIETTSGDIDIEVSEEFESMNVKCVSGDIDIQCAYLDYSAQIETVSGCIDDDTDVEPKMHSSHSAMIGQGKSKILVKTTSGDISISS